MAKQSKATSDRENETPEQESPEKDAPTTEDPSAKDQAADTAPETDKTTKPEADDETAKDDKEEQVVTEQVVTKVSPSASSEKAAKDDKPADKAAEPQGPQSDWRDKVPPILMEIARDARSLDGKTIVALTVLLLSFIFMFTGLTGSRFMNLIFLACPVLIGWMYAASREQQKAGVQPKLMLINGTAGLFCLIAVWSLAGSQVGQVAAPADQGDQTGKIAAKTGDSDPTGDNGGKTDPTNTGKTAGKKAGKNSGKQRSLLDEMPSTLTPGGDNQNNAGVVINPLTGKPFPDAGNNPLSTPSNPLAGETSYTGHFEGEHLGMPASLNIKEADGRITGEFMHGQDKYTVVGRVAAGRAAGKLQHPTKPDGLFTFSAKRNGSTLNFKLSIKNAQTQDVTVVDIAMKAS